MASKRSGERETFEALYHRLESVVAKLEQGGLTLEESLALYEEGMKLASRCQQVLRQAELKISRLQDQFAGLREPSEAYTAGEEDAPPEELTFE